LQYSINNQNKNNFSSKKKLTLKKRKTNSIEQVDFTRELLHPARKKVRNLRGNNKPRGRGRAYSRLPFKAKMRSLPGGIRRRSVLHPQANMLKQAQVQVLP